MIKITTEEEFEREQRHRDREILARFVVAFADASANASKAENRTIDRENFAYRGRDAAQAAIAAFERLEDYLDMRYSDPM